MSEKKYSTVQVFEDTPTKLDLNSQLTSDLLAMREILKNDLILQADGVLRVCHYVGFIHYNKTRLLVYPKYVRNQNDKETFDEAFNIMIRMLAETGYMNIRRIPSAQSMASDYNSDILEIMISLFIDELTRMFQRDINRGYQETSENEPFIRGRIDFPNHIRKNSYRQHLHVLKYQHFTEDILLNRIFKAVITDLLKTTKVISNRTKLKQALLWLEDVNDIQLIDDAWNQVVFNRLNDAYQTVFNMAKLFYEKSMLKFSAGPQKSLSFLVPLNQLFEKYVYTIFNNIRRESDIIISQGPQRALAKVNNSSFINLRPDISLTRNDIVVTIMDAKYKELKFDGDKPELLASDIYQMVAYKIRYECDDIMLVYPAMIEQKPENPLVSEIVIETENSRTRIRIVLIDLAKNVTQIGKQLENLLYAEH